MASPISLTRPRLKVLWVTKIIGLGGVEKLLMDTARLIDHRQFEISCVFLYSRHISLTEVLASRGIRCIDLSGSKGGLIGRFFALIRLVIGGDWDIVHVHSPLVGSVARFASRLRTKRRPGLVTTEHNTWQSYHPITRWLNFLTLKLDDRVLAVSEDTAKGIRRPIRGKVEISVQGVLLDYLRECTELDNPLPLGVGLHDSAVLVCVANLRENKDHQTLISALAVLKERGEKTLTLLVGDGPLMDFIASEIARLGLEGSVELLGRRADVPAILQASDLFVLTSRYEGGAPPVAVMEALSLGLPIVASDIGSIREGLRDSGAALLFEPGNPIALADAIEDLLANPAEMTRMSAAARVFSSRFDLQRVVARLEQIYLEVHAAR